jgi:hypothetical protein
MNRPAYSPRGTKQTVRIVLGETASRHLDTTGCKAFAVVGKERSKEHPGRWVIHLRDASHLEAQDASDVLMGKKKAVELDSINLKP